MRQKSWFPRWYRTLCLVAVCSAVAFAGTQESEPSAGTPFAPIRNEHAIPGKRYQEYQPTIGNTTSDINFFSADVTLKRRLATGSGRGHLTQNIELLYSGASVQMLRNQRNDKADLDVVGLGWKLSAFSSFTADHKGTVDTSDDEYYYHNDAGVARVLRKEGQSWTIASMPYWRVERSIGGSPVQFIGWIVTDPSGNTYRYGDFKPGNTIPYSPNATRYILAFGTSLNPPGKRPASSDEDVLFPHMWDLSSVTDYTGNNTVTYHYLQDQGRIIYDYGDPEQWLSTNNYTQNSRIDKILFPAGRQIQFVYSSKLLKEYDDGLGSAEQVAKSRNYDFLQYYYLDEVLTKNEHGLLLKEIQLGYEFAAPIPTKPEYDKRRLESISFVEGTSLGNDLTEVFDYDDTKNGLLSKITNPDAGTIEYRFAEYGKRELGSYQKTNTFPISAPGMAQFQASGDHAILLHLTNNASDNAEFALVTWPWDGRGGLHKYHTTRKSLTGSLAYDGLWTDQKNAWRPQALLSQNLCALMYRDGNGATAQAKFTTWEFIHGEWVEDAINLPFDNNYAADDMIPFFGMSDRRLAIVETHKGETGLDADSTGRIHIYRRNSKSNSWIHEKTYDSIHVNSVNTPGAGKFQQARPQLIVKDDIVILLEPRHNDFDSNHDAREGSAQLTVFYHTNGTWAQNPQVLLSHTDDFHDSDEGIFWNRHTRPAVWPQMVYDEEKVSLVTLTDVGEWDNEGTTHYTATKAKIYTWPRNTFASGGQFSSSSKVTVDLNFTPTDPEGNSNTTDDNHYLPMLSAAKGRLAVLIPGENNSGQVRIFRWEDDSWAEETVNGNSISISHTDEFSGNPHPRALFAFDGERLLIHNPDLENYKEADLIAYNLQSDGEWDKQTIAFPGPDDWRWYWLTENPQLMLLGDHFALSSRHAATGSAYYVAEFSWDPQEHNWSTGNWTAHTFTDNTFYGMPAFAAAGRNSMHVLHSNRNTGSDNSSKETVDFERANEWYLPEKRTVSHSIGAFETVNRETRFRFPDTLSVTPDGKAIACAFATSKTDGVDSTEYYFNTQFGQSFIKTYDPRGGFRYKTIVRKVVSTRDEVLKNEVEFEPTDFRDEAKWHHSIYIARPKSIQRYREKVLVGNTTILRYNPTNGIPDSTVNDLTSVVPGHRRVRRIDFAFNEIPEMGLSGSHQIGEICTSWTWDDKDANGVGGPGELRACEGIAWNNADDANGLWRNGTGKWLPVATWAWYDSDLDSSGLYDDGDGKLVQYASYDKYGNVFERLGIDRFLWNENAATWELSVPADRVMSYRFAFDSSLANAVAVNASASELAIGLFDAGSLSDEGWNTGDPLAAVYGGECVFSSRNSPPLQHLNHTINVQQAKTYTVEFEARLDEESPSPEIDLIIELATDEEIGAHDIRRISKTRTKYHLELQNTFFPDNSLVSVRFYANSPGFMKMHIDNIVVRPKEAQISVTGYDPHFRFPNVGIDDRYQFSFSSIDNAGRIVANSDSSKGTIVAHDLTYFVDDPNEPTEAIVTTFAYPNFAPNYSFERSSNGIVDGWSAHGSPTSIALECGGTSPNAKFGRWVAKIDPDYNDFDGLEFTYFGGEYDGTGYTSNDPQYWALVSKKVKFSVWIFSSTARTFSIGVLTNSGTDQSDSFVPAGKWTKISHIVPILLPYEPAPADPKRLTFFIGIQSDAVFYLDGAMLQIVDLEETTASPVVNSTYYDGFGKKRQTAIRVPDTTYISAICYNKVSGRMDTLFKPYRTVEGDNLLKYDPNYKANCEAQYGGQSSFPFVQRWFVSGDPFGRINIVGSPGPDFHIGSGHEREFTYLTTDTKSSTEQAAADHKYFLEKRLDENQDTPVFLWRNALGQNDKTQIGYTEGSPVISEREFDWAGRITKETNPDNPAFVYTRKEYDGAGRLRLRDQPNLDGSLEYLYDVHGNLRLLKSPRLAAQDSLLVHEYDLLGRLEAVELVQGIANFSNVNAESKTALNGTGSMKTRFYYDDYSRTPQGLRQLVSDEISGSAGRSKGRLVAQASFLNGEDWQEHNVVLDVFVYDDYGNVIEHVKKIPGLQAKKKTMTYRPDRSIASAKMSDAAGSQFFFYDSRGRLSRATTGATLSTATRVAEYRYNVLGSIAELKLGSDTNGDPLETVDYIYNDRNWITSIEGSHITQKLGYNKRGEISDATNGLQNHIDDFQPQYNGNVAWNTLDRTTHFSRGYLYNYDSYGRLAKAIDGEKPASQWTTPTVGDRTMIASYKQDGRFAYRRMEAGHDGETGTDNYSYQPNTHRLDHISGTKIIASAPTQNPGNYVYDPNGNVVADKSRKMIVDYDYRNRPVRYRFYEAGINGSVWDSLLGDGELEATVVFLYDAVGQRVSKKEVE